MMLASIWQFLLDVDSLPNGLEQGRLGWERAPAPWMWVLLIFGAGLFAIWSYHGLVGGRKSRGALAGLRFLLIVLIGVLLAGPAWVVQRDLVERDWVLFLVDRSASLNVADVGIGQGGDGARNRQAREAQLENTLRTNEATLQEIEKDHDVLWLGFDSGVFDLPPGPYGGPELGEANGLRTDINAALSQALARVAGRPVGGIAILSDGRSMSAPSPEVLRRLASEAVSVFAVPLGSAEAVGDLAIAQVDAPRIAFSHDIVPVEVSIDRLGGGVSGPVDVLVRDEATGMVLDRRPITEEEGDRVVLLVKPRSARDARWRVELAPRETDLVEANNSTTVEIQLVDRPLRVLYVEDRPRWEYHFIKTIMVREPTIDSSVMLLSADRDFAQEGTTPIARMPNSPAEWEPFDVIILGDVHANFFSIAQQEMILQHVSESGAGVLLVAGERHNPVDFLGTKLGALGPLRTGATPATLNEPVVMVPSDAARRLSVMQILLGGRDAWPILYDATKDWTSLRWGWKLEPRWLKPAVETLAWGVPVSDAGGGEPASAVGWPLVTSMRYGAGQVAMVATDEIWRWRFGLGETLPEQFWIQIMRMLSRDRLSMSGQGAVLNVNPRRVDVGQPVVVDLRLIDAELIERGVNEIPIEVVNTQDGSSSALTMRVVGEGGDRFEATLIADQAGTFDVKVDDPALSRYNLSARFEAQLRDDEMRDPSTDHALLATLAGQTDGSVVQADDFSTLPARLPNRAVRTPVDLVEPLWDTPLALILVLILLTAEWVGRKLVRLT